MGRLGVVKRGGVKVGIGKGKGQENGGRVKGGIMGVGLMAGGRQGWEIRVG